MSQIPPGQSDGWIDPNGQLQPGFPPPGYWQASDGRWYPPDAASADTQAVNPHAQQPFTPPTPASYEPAPQGPPGYDYSAPAPNQFGAPVPGQPAGAPGAHYGGQPAGFTPGGPKKSRTGIYAVIGVVALAVAGCTGIGVVALARGGDTDVATDATTVTTDGVDDTTETTGADPANDTDDTVGGTEATATTAANLSGVPTAPGAGSVGDGSGCEIIDDTTIRVELVNDSAATQSYFLTVGFFDGDTRLGDTVAIVSNLRPGERTIEDTFYFDQEGSRCEILEADGFEVSYDQAALADVSPCEITGTDTFGDIESELTVTNNGSATYDYSVQLAFIDPEGIRRGTGFANIEAVRAGETAPSDVFTVVEAADGIRCEIIGVDRTDN
ncbi:MAG: hypothetical protein ACR2QO_17235 [Acidimicrobiales bacterium]